MHVIHGQACHLSVTSRPAAAALHLPAAAAVTTRHKPHSRPCNLCSSCTTINTTATAVTATIYILRARHADVTSRPAQVRRRVGCLLRWTVGRAGGEGGRAVHTWTFLWLAADHPPTTTTNTTNTAAATVTQIITCLPPSSSCVRPEGCNHLLHTRPLR
jgi:hypothetical protein